MHFQGRYVYTHGSAKKADSSVDAVLKDKASGDSLIVRVSLSEKHGKGKAIFSQVRGQRIQCCTTLYLVFDKLNEVTNISVSRNWTMSVSQPVISLCGHEDKWLVGTIPKIMCCVCVIHVCA
jgi:hypothetical protein